MGRMPEEDDALEGQGPVPARAESGSGIPPALSTSAAPTAPVAPVSNAGVRRVPPVLRTEAPIPPQSDVVQPSARHGAPPSATQGSSQTEGRQPEVLEEGVTEDERSTPNLSQGQLFPDQQENASESEVKDLHHVDIGVSPSRFQVDSPVAPSGAPDDDILDDASHQLDTPPPAIPGQTRDSKQHLKRHGCQRKDLSRSASDCLEMATSSLCRLTWMRCEAATRLRDAQSESK